LAKGNLMHRPFLATSLGVLLLLGSGCKSTLDPKNAIRDGVIRHIAGVSGLNVNNMTVIVTKAEISGDKAQADVDIRAKNGDPNTPPMQLTYELQKQGDEWVVLKGEGKGGMQHPTSGEMPNAGALPAGHPSIKGQIPANHPDFNAILNSAEPQPQSGSSQQQTPDAGSAKP
jgi:hypothetical protein